VVIQSIRHKGLRRFHATGSTAGIQPSHARKLRMQLAVPEGSYPVSLRGSPEHRALAKEAACKAIVLLKNEAVSPGSPLLPLDPGRSLAVIGRLAAEPNLGDRGSSDTRPDPGSVITPLAGLQQAAPDLEIGHARGNDAPAAAALAGRMDAAVVVVGLDWCLEGEHIHPGDIAPILELIPPPDWLLQLLGRRLILPCWRPVARAIAWITSHGTARAGGDFAAGDRTDLQLPPDQVALILQVAAANPRTVVVLMGGGAILPQEWQAEVPALLLLWCCCHTQPNPTGTFSAMRPRRRRPRWSCSSTVCPSLTHYLKRRSCSCWTPLSARCTRQGARWVCAAGFRVIERGLFGGS
jgi:beta-glucosidase